MKWEYVNGKEYHVFKCSNCGKYQSYKSNYCEDCGEKALTEEEEKKDEEREKVKEKYKGYDTLWQY